MFDITLLWATCLQMEMTCVDHIPDSDTPNSVKILGKILLKEEPVFDISAKDHMIKMLKETCYNADAVLAREDKTRELFDRHKDLIHPAATSHVNYYEIAFGRMPTGEGVLDLGTGNAGCLCVWEHIANFTPPRIASDIYMGNINVTPGFIGQQLSATDVLATFGENSFDHVQCCETLEHVTEEESTDIARQMAIVTRKTAFITSCGLSHHLGPDNMEKVQVNKYLEYKGQPNIEMLMDLGYQVRLLANYQILAWYIKK